MSNLITITTRFYDKSGSYFANLEVQSRYKGSSKVNMQKTNDQGVFVFQASPNRTIEILARPLNKKILLYLRPSILLYFHHELIQLRFNYLKQLLNIIKSISPSPPKGL